MPRNVRNFWVELTVDGKSSRIATGPVSKDGGFELTVRMRSNGGIIRALDLRGYVAGDGALTLRASSGLTHEGELLNPEDIVVTTSR